MRFIEGDIVKRKNTTPGNHDIGLVVEADTWEGFVEVLLFDADGPYTRRFSEYDAEDLLEIDDG